MINMPDNIVITKDIESFYVEKFSGQEFLIIWEYDNIKDNISLAIQQLEDIIWYWIFVRFVVNIPDTHQDVILRFSNIIWLEFINIQGTKEEIIDYAFDFANDNNIWKIIYLNKGMINDNMWKWLNVVNKCVYEQLDISWDLEDFLSLILNKVTDANNVVKRFQIVNVAIASSLFNEIFSVDWAWNWNWVIVSEEFKLDIDKLENMSKKVISFVYKFLITGWKYVKSRSMEYINQNISNFFVWSVDGIPVWVFELKDIWNGVMEVGAFVVYNNLQWLKIWSVLMDKVCELKNAIEYKDNLFIVVTYNDDLKKILRSRGFVVGCVRDRYMKMIQDNINEWVNREMFMVR